MKGVVNVTSAMAIEALIIFVIGSPLSMAYPTARWKQFQ
jgi:hypothetical protein